MKTDQHHRDQIIFNPLGVIHSDFKSRFDHVEMKKHESTIEVFPEYVEALYRLDESDFIEIYYFFHLSKDYDLITTTYSGETRGIFSSRVPRRPNRLAHTTVKLIRIDGNKLIVKGLDAADESPLIDIKACDNSIFENDQNAIRRNKQRINPRNEIIKHVKADEIEDLLLKAGQIHGHFCPGLAMGVIAAAFAIKTMGVNSDGMEEVLAITETNNCFSDGIQFVTGCTFGNNALIFQDLGKTAFSLVRRNGEGLRISVKEDTKEVINHLIKSEFHTIFEEVVKNQHRNKEKHDQFKRSGKEKAFAMLNMDIRKLFLIEDVKTIIPDYAPSYESIICDGCGEPVMASRIVKIEKKRLCINCADEGFYQLDGNGIKEVKHLSKKQK
ncbi:MAG: SAM-dependent methyltransferase [Bacteroidales bacterium]|nr:SAM-dependent methyltransferase [Bacteroidales bacterium]